jgi:hypothetical protein
MGESRVANDKEQRTKYKAQSTEYKAQVQSSKLDAFSRPFPRNMLLSLRESTSVPLQGEN